MSKCMKMSKIEAQRLQRIKVNRIAIIQSLRVEHVLPILMQRGVITEGDKQALSAGRNAQIKAKNLLDILMQKGRDINWYGSFREALRDPDTRSIEAKRKYAMLIEFLDNTILPSDSQIMKIEAQMKLPHYEPLPGIMNSPSKPRCGSRVTFDLPDSSDARYSENEVFSHTEEEKGMMDSDVSETYGRKPLTLIKGYFHKWVPSPENFATLIDEPTGLLQSLEQSGNSNAQEQLKLEKMALEQARKLEVIFALNRRKQLPDGMELCMSSIVEDIFTDESAQHLYLKYFHALKEKFNLDIPAELACSFCNFIETAGDASDVESRNNIIEMGFALFEFLCDYGSSHRAVKVMDALISFLSSYNGIATWIPLWEAHVKLIKFHNININFTEADSAYNAALPVAGKIKSHLNGHDLMDESAMFCELSRLMREQGSLLPAQSWALKALKEVEADNLCAVIEVLCCASEAFCANFEVSKAEDFALEAVRRARVDFGMHSPVYIKALLCYCHYSNEFRQDPIGIASARAAVQLAETIYNTRHMTRALAHQALARALVVAREFGDEEYFQNAVKACQLALDILPGNHPRLGLFKYTMAQCLHWRASVGDPGMKDGNLVWAEAEAKAALDIFSSNWGKYSLRTASAHNLLGQIYAKMKRYQDAENMLDTSISIYRKSVPPHCLQMYLMKATLGNFYKEVDRPSEAIIILKEIVDEINSKGVYFEWVHLSYDSLIFLLRAVDNNEEADKYQEALMDWMSRHPRPESPITWAQLHAAPVPYEQWYRTLSEAEPRVPRTCRRGFKFLRENLINSPLL